MDEQTENNLDVLERTSQDQEQELEWEFVKEEEQRAEDEAAEKAARAGAQMAVSFVKTLTTMKWPYVQIDKDSEEQVVEKTAAVTRKYGGGLPPWLEPYREEIELGFVVAAVGAGVYIQVKAHQQAEAEREQAEGMADAGQAGQPEYATH